MASDAVPVLSARVASDAGLRFVRIPDVGRIADCSSLASAKSVLAALRPYATYRRGSDTRDGSRRGARAQNPGQGTRQGTAGK